MRLAAFSVVLALAAACAIAFNATRTEPASATVAPGTFVPLEVDGVRGGELSCDLAGTVPEVLEMLLDFDAAEGNRAWAARYSTLSREESEAVEAGARVLARWSFRGKLGVAPTVDLEFRTERDGDHVVVPFEVVEDAFGLAVFSGEYRLSAASESPPVTRLTQRVFISSGLPFVDASSEDIENGLREDARLMAEWMAARSAP